MDTDINVAMSLKSRFIVTFGIYNYDVIYDVMVSMQTLKCGTPKVPYPDVHIDTIIFILWSLCIILWIYIWSSYFA